MRDTLAAYPYVVVRLDCTLCTRTGRYRLARLCDKYGADIAMEDMLAQLAGDCAYWGRRRHPIRPGCGARFKDLEPPRQPPDMPPDRRLRIAASGGRTTVDHQ
ncbi:MAG TPA: hypothetical protein P5307_15735 [Pirellulaceae bacterium]|nr:hypothetical protein [Pirellulaceae bacterium]